MAWWNKDEGSSDIKNFPCTMVVRSTEFHHNKGGIFEHLSKHRSNTVAVTKWDKPTYVIMNAGSYLELLEE